MRASKKSRFHAPLEPLDTEARTVGCRHTSPDICAKNAMEGICAFVRFDGYCLAPPASWPKQFKRLRGGLQRSGL